MNVVGLFSGIGCIEYGLERSGMRPIAFCERDPYCQAVLRKHWPGLRCYPDIRELDGKTIQRDLGHFGRIDVMSGGFPCQDISNAGKRAGIGGDRSGLWTEFARLIGEVRPRYVIVENVAALLGRGIERVLGDLAALWYDCYWSCIPASYVGAPHDRDRVWIVANSKWSERWAESLHGALGRMGREQQSVPWDRDWQSALREFRGMDDGRSYRVDRIDTLRNAVVPQIPEAIGRAILSSHQ